MINTENIQRHAAEYLRWFEAEKAKGLVDVKFCLGETAKSSREEIFAEANLMLAAETVEDHEIF